MFSAHAAAAMEWNNETTLEFLRHYKAEPILWDPMHVEYKDKKKTYDAWSRIGLAMDLDVFELKKKKESVMATFRGHVRKKRGLVERAKLPRAADAYKPSWFAYEFMEGFLGPMYQLERYTEEEEVRVGERAIIKKRKVGDSDAANEESIFIDENSSSINEEPGHADEGDEPADKRDPLWMEPSSPILNCTSTTTTTSTTRPAEERKQRILQNERTEFDIFGTSVAAQLNTMQWEDAIDLQLQIQQLMTQYRLSVHRRSRRRVTGAGQGGGGSTVSPSNVVLMPSSTCNRETISFKEEDFKVTY